MVPLNLRIGQPQLDALRKLEAKSGYSVAEHIRRAIDMYVDADKGIVPSRQPLPVPEIN